MIVFEGNLGKTEKHDDKIARTNNPIVSVFRRNYKTVNYRHNFYKNVTTVYE